MIISKIPNLVSLKLLVKALFVSPVSDFITIFGAIFKVRIFIPANAIITFAAVRACGGSD